MSSTRHIFTEKWASIQNELITPCLVSHAAPLFFSNPLAEMKVFSALWDTGATNSVISKNVVSTLNLKHEGYITVVHVNGSDDVPLYHVNLLLPNAVAFVALKVAQTELTGCDVLIGMDIINKGDFAVSNKNGKTMFSFRIPSITDFDFESEYAHSTQ